MIISDDTHLAGRFKVTLLENGFNTTIFSRPNMGLNELKLFSQQYSLLLIDYTCQVKNSTRDFPKQVKEINDQIRIILVSGFHFSEQYISVKGYDGFLQLPVAQSKLMTTVREIMLIYGKQIM